MNFKSLSAVLTLSLAAATSTFAHATMIAAPTAASIDANINVAGSNSIDVEKGTLALLTATAFGTLNGVTLNGAPVTLNTSVLTYSTSSTINFGPTGAFVYGTDGASFFATTESGVLGQTVRNGQTYNVLELSGAGYFTENGYANTAGTYDLTTQQLVGAASGDSTTFSASTGTNAATPEPSSLILLGTGALGAAGMVRRRFGKVTA